MVDFRNIQLVVIPLITKGEIVERIDVYFYSHWISSEVDCTLNTMRTHKVCWRRNYFLMKLNKVNVCRANMSVICPISLLSSQFYATVYFAGVEHFRWRRKCWSIEWSDHWDDATNCGWTAWMTKETTYITKDPPLPLHMLLNIL